MKKSYSKCYFFEADTTRHLQIWSSFVINDLQLVSNKIDQAMRSNVQLCLIILDQFQLSFKSLSIESKMEKLLPQVRNIISSHEIHVKSILNEKITEHLQRYISISDLTIVR